MTNYKDIVLIHPPQPRSLDDRLNPPMGLMYLASFIRGNTMGAINVRIVDLSSVPREEWKEAIGEADLYGCTMYTTSYSICKEIAGITKDISPDSIFVVGGAHPTALPWSTAQEEWVNAVVVGKGEEAFLQLLYTPLPHHGRSQHITSWNTGRGFLRYVDPPAFDLVDMSSYSRSLNGRRAPALYTYRGCQYDCQFCSSLHGRHPEYYTPEHITSILEYYRDEGYEDIVVWDSFFTNRRSRWYGIADEIHDMGMKYRCNGKIGVETEEDLRKLRDTGCTLFNIGLESGSQFIIDRMRKRFTVGEARDYIQMVKDVGLNFRVYLQFGFPGEDRGTMEETMAFIEEVDVDQYSCFTHNPFPGSAVYSNPESYGITWLSSNWDDYYTVAGTDGLGGMPFDTIWMSREEGLEMNREFVQFLRSRTWTGPTEEYHKLIGVGNDT